MVKGLSFGDWLSEFLSLLGARGVTMDTLLNLYVPQFPW